MTETVIYLREEGSSDTTAHRRVGSLTLGQLQEELHATAVLECDSDGVPTRRGVALSGTDDVLHSGGHYLVRRGGRNGPGCVTFSSTVQVQEFSLPGDHSLTAGSEHRADPAPPAAQGSVRYVWQGTEYTATPEEVQRALTRDVAAVPGSLGTELVLAQAHKVLLASKALVL